MAATAAPPPPAQQATVFARWVPSLPTINLNALNPFANGDDGGRRSVESARQNGDAATNTKRPTLSPLSFGSSTSATPPSPLESNADIMFAEPDTRSTSEADSREGSVLSPKKNSNKPKTRYSVCHPPPASMARHKLHRRPRSLLQLHRLSSSTRPKPAFDVIPSANFSVRLTRAITRLFRAKHGLCPNDLVVLRAEKYSAEEEDEEQEARDVIGLICKGRKDDAAMAGGKAKIYMASGQAWEAYPLMNGGYEFFSTDEHGLGLTVRWVPKKNKDSSKMKDKRFNFSTISPNSRRHPVIAALSEKALEVNDKYKMPDQAAVTPLSTPKAGSQSALADAMDDGAGGQQQCETDDILREIIVVTGLWVTFKEGWSPTFKYDEKESASSTAAGTLGRSASASISNSPSKSITSPLATPPGSPSQVPLDKRNSIRSMSSSIFRRNSLLSKSNRASQVSVPEEDAEALRRSDSVNRKAGRARGDSTSTVLIHRAASNRKKNNYQATWRPDLLDAQHPLNETSREHLSGTPPPPQPDSVFDLPATPTPTQRRESVARPLIPPAVDEEAPRGAMTPTPTRRGTPAPAGRTQQTVPPQSGSSNDFAKRVSTATTDTGSSGAGPSKVAQGVKGGKKKRNVFRKLFCGSKHT